MPLHGGGTAASLQRGADVAEEGLGAGVADGAAQRAGAGSLRRVEGGGVVGVGGGEGGSVRGSSCGCGCAR